MISRRNRRHHALGRTAAAARALYCAATIRLAVGDLETGEAATRDALAYARAVNGRSYEQQLLAALAGLALARCDLPAVTSLLDAIPGETYSAALLRGRWAERGGDVGTATALLPPVETAFGVPFILAIVHGGRGGGAGGCTGH